MPFPEDVLSELRTIVKAQWPDIGDRLYEAEHIMQLPLDTVGASLPAAAILSSKWPHDPSFRAMGERIFTSDIEIYYIGSQQAGPQTTLRAKVSAMGQYLDRTSRQSDFASGQIRQVILLDWGPTIPFNMLMAERQTAMRAGLVTVRISAGYDP